MSRPVRELQIFSKKLIAGNARPFNRGSKPCIPAW